VIKYSSSLSRDRYLILVPSALQGLLPRGYFFSGYFFSGYFFNDSRMSAARCSSSAIKIP